MGLVFHFGYVPPEEYIKNNGLVSTVNRDFKQTDTAAERRRSTGKSLFNWCQGPTEFTCPWALLNGDLIVGLRLTATTLRSLIILKRCHHTSKWVVTPVSQKLFYPFKYHVRSTLSTRTENLRVCSVNPALLILFGCQHLEPQMHAQCVNIIPIMVGKW